ncbi:YihY/virulence factor BrkB family protein [Bacteroides sp. 214]|uniref:YihY/virulence factor BrkB family protein n=1 Tax=Bacteroides sp. 214 TaxID=2302935 RepID=UPI0013CFC85A|nr:YihY/virulence factor BrkB family protein [Bacteroides sp. 214]NDW11382.1 YihY/virulence factor BrkB family protein [Bacteroides sp. 214]
MKKHITFLWEFLTEDIWRVTKHDVTSKRFSLYNVIKVIYLTANRFVNDKVSSKASALTYNTLLAIVPILAILFAITRGFGFSNLVESHLVSFFGGVNETTETLLSFVDSYLSQTKSGIFIGIGLALLFWTVLNLISNIESTFNHIWNIKKERSMHRKITDYFSMLLFIPILLVLSSGVSIITGTILKQVEEYVMLAPFIKFLVKSIPYVLVWFMFTALYIFMPNTKVKFKHAFLAGVIAGTVFQIFQFLYISGQIWVTRYNAIYGGFAAIPLLLLWLQMSWTICLFGVELAYASQNIHSYSFDKDIRNISRRYKDFICILIMSLITKRFAANKTPYSANELSEQHKIPINLVQQTLFLLLEINLIHEVMTDAKSDEITYQPSMDTDKLDIATLMNRIESHGSEEFRIEYNPEFKGEWEAMLNLKEDYYRKASNILLKDL